MKSRKVGPLVSAVKHLKEFAHKKLFRYMVATGLVMCAARTDADSFTDARYFVTATAPSSYDAAGYQNTGIPWTEVTLISEFPEYGPMADVNKFTPIYGAIKKVKRTPDFGGGTLVYADLPSDAGQIIVKTYATSQSHLYWMIVYSDGEKCFLDSIVLSCRKAKAASGDFQIRNAQLEFNRAPVEVAAP